MKSSQIAIRALTASCALVTTMSAIVSTAHSEPRSLDAATIDILGLGDGNGCTKLVPDADFDATLDGLFANGQLGEQLYGICFTSDVSTGAALGGAAGSAVSTMTASQLGVDSRRVDRRTRGKPASTFNQIDEVKLALAGDGVVELPGKDERRFDVFATGHYEDRRRNADAFEAGYNSDITGGTIGADYLVTPTVLVGVVARYDTADGNFDDGSPLVSALSVDNAPDVASLRAAVSPPGVLARLCGVTPGGEFERTTPGVGTYIGVRAGRALIDVSASHRWSDYDYTRNICAIETQGAVIYNPATNNLEDSQGVVNEVFAGRIRGRTNISENALAARISYPMGNERWEVRPFVGVAWSQATIDAYQESGAATRPTTVVNNTGGLNAANFVVNGPTGMELAFDEQTSTSLQSSVGFEVATRIDTPIGRLAPFVSATYIHEFDDDQREITAHFVQDERAAPTVVTFNNGRPDRDYGIVAGGATLELSPGVAFGVGAHTVVGDDRYDAWGVNVGLKFAL